MSTAPDAGVGGCDPALLLPARRAGEESRLALPLSVVDAVSLGDGRWATVVADAAGTLLAVPLVPDAEVPGGVRRARPGDGAAQALLAVLAGGRRDLGPFESVPVDPVLASGESGLDVDQTHDSVVVGLGSADAVVVKWSVHVEAVPGDPPSVAAARHLAAVGFTRTPAPVGFLVHHDRGRQLLVASVARFLPGAQDGWDWYVDDLLAHLAGRLTLEGAVRPALALGALVAELHAAFGTAWSGCPDPVTSADEQNAQRWLQRALATADEAAELTGGAPGERFRARVGAARGVVEDGLRSAPGTPLTRVHGDLHLGQVLRWEGGYVVSDFDGNPVLPAAERGLPQPPARDVAGMLRALDHVGRIANRRTSYGCVDEVREWTAQVRNDFLSAYRRTLADAGHGELFDESLLAAFEVEQECRELVYAARHLPQWVYVPDAALTDLFPGPGRAEV